MSQYPDPPFAGPPPYQMQRSAEWMQGSKHAQTSLILGIIGLFVVGIVLGPLAISQAKKAERLNTAATAGKVLGWIDTIFGIIGVIWFIVIIGGMIALSSSGY